MCFKGGYFFSIVLLVVCVTGFSQKQNNQWRFGSQGGISFNTTPPSSVAGAVLSTFEGSASVADKNSGNLLFYTDGITVWNAQNQPMPNGNGLLGGTPALLSSTTAAVIIPRPGTNNEYYLITIDEQSSNNGIRYSLVDMNLDNGLGDIVSGFKNIPVYQTNSEKLEVVPASDKQSYWLISHDLPGNSFLAFKVTASGIQTTPVVSTVGGVQGNGSGHLKINRQFNKLAMGNFFDRSIELFDFDNSTGVVSNPVIWNYNASNPPVYGVEFSPNGKLLYVSNLEFITQYDITSSSSTAIQNSRFVLPSSGFSQPASLQLGPDNKIYINAGSVNVINCPDNPGIDCGFQSGVIANQNGGGGYGFPKWVYYAADVAQPAVNSISSVDSCAGKPVQFSLQNSSGVNNIIWSFDDPGSGPNNSSTQLSPSHIFSNPGNYTVKAILSYTCRKDTIQYNITIKNCSVVCNADIVSSADSCLNSSFPFSIATNSNIISVNWNFDDPGSGVNNTSVSQTPNHTFSTPGIYSVVAIVNLSCGVDTIIKTIRIVNCALPIVISINSSTDSCAGANIPFTIASNQTITEVRWNFDDPGSALNNTSTSSTPTHIFSKPGIYQVFCEVKINCGAPPNPNNPVITPCFFIDTIYKTVKIVTCDTPTIVKLNISVPNAFSPNADDINDFFGPLSGIKVENYELIIFNRWGQPIFSSMNPNEAWDGKYKSANAPVGTYYYLLRYQLPSQKKEFMKGTLTLLR